MYALVLAGAGGSPPLCRCDLRLSSPWGRVCALVLAGAGGSPPLRRCDLHANGLPANCLVQGVGCTPWCWVVLAGAGGSPPLCCCGLRANCLLQAGRMYALVLAGAGGSLPLCRCDLRSWCSKTLCFQGAVGVEDLKFGEWRNAKLWVLQGWCR